MKKVRRRYDSQKDIKDTNISKILDALLIQPLSFTELYDQTGLSKPILSKHLKSLKKEGTVSRTIINDRIVYKLTKGAFRLRLLHTLIFKNSAYRRIQRELVKDREAYISKETVMYQDKERREGFVSLELDPKFIAEKSDFQIIQAVDKWLTPIILYAMIQELRTGNDWTKIVYGLSQKLVELIKLKDISKFEETLRTIYSERLDSLDDILEYIKVQQEIDLLEKEDEKRIKNLGGESN